MRKITVLFLILVLIFCVSGCTNADSSSSDTDKQIVVLPDEETAKTVNGYRNNEAATSSDINLTSSALVSSNYESAASQPETSYYVGNKNSKKFHTQYCKYVSSISHKNLHSFATIDDALNEGYSPCSQCIDQR